MTEQPYAAALAVVALCWTCAGSAAAQASSDEAAGPSTQDRALAEALFRQGKELGEAGQITEACKKFAESHRLDPALGTLLHLAACYAEEGKTASAWAAFTAAAELAETAKQKSRQTLARERAAELESQLSRLVIEVPKPSPGMVVELDGREIGEGTLSTPLPIDPGMHLVSVMAPGKRRWQRELEVPKGPVTETLEVPELVDQPPDAAPVTRAEPAPAPPPVAEAPEANSSQRILGFVVGGAGLASLAAGSYFGLRAAAQADDADSHCRGEICTQEGLDGHERAGTSALLANIFFGVGIAAVAGGTYLVITATEPSPAPNARALWLGAGVGQLRAGGSW